MEVGQPCWPLALQEPSCETRSRQPGIDRAAGAKAEYTAPEGVNTKCLGEGEAEGREMTGAAAGFLRSLRYVDQVHCSTAAVGGAGRSGRRAAFRPGEGLGCPAAGQREKRGCVKEWTDEMCAREGD